MASYPHLYKVNELATCRYQDSEDFKSHEVLTMKSHCKLLSELVATKLNPVDRQ